MSEHTHLHTVSPNAPHTCLQGLGEEVPGALLQPGSLLCHVSYRLLPSGVGHEVGLKDLPAGISSPSPMFMSEQAGNVPKDERASQTYTTGNYIPCGGEPLPLTKNISPPPNFRLKIEKKLGRIMNSRNSDNEEQPRD